MKSLEELKEHAKVKMRRNARRAIIKAIINGDELEELKEHAKVKMRRNARRAIIKAIINGDEQVILERGYLMIRTEFTIAGYKVDYNQEWNRLVIDLN